MILKERKQRKIVFITGKFFKKNRYADNNRNKNIYEMIIKKILITFL